MCPAWLVSTSFISEHTLEPTTLISSSFCSSSSSSDDVTPSLQLPNSFLFKPMLSIPTLSSSPHSVVPNPSLPPSSTSSSSSSSSNFKGSPTSTRFPFVLFKSVSDSTISYLPSPSPSLSPTSSTSSSFLLPDSLTSTLSSSEQPKGWFHPVSPTDTLPGIAIKYGIQNLTVFRQVNFLTRDTHIFAKPYLYIPASTTSSTPSFFASPPLSTTSNPNATFSLLSSDTFPTSIITPTTVNHVDMSLSTPLSSNCPTSTSTLSSPSSTTSPSSLSNMLTSIDQEIQKAKHGWNALKLTCPPSSNPIPFPFDAKPLMIELKPMFRSSLSRSSTSSTTNFLKEEKKSKT